MTAGGASTSSNSTNGSLSQNDAGVYITFYKKEDAARCIQAVEGTIYEGRVLKYDYQFFLFLMNLF